MPRMTGKGGACVVAGQTYILTEWSYEEQAKLLEQPACGDTWTERSNLRNDYTVEFEGYLSTGKPYTNAAIPTGAVAATTLKFVSTDTTAFFSDAAAMVERSRVTLNDDQSVKIRGTLKNSTGAAGPVITLTG